MMNSVNGNPIDPATIINARALNHPKVVEFAQVISKAQQDNNLDAIRVFLIRETAAIIATAYGELMWQAAAMSTHDLLVLIRQMSAEEQGGIQKTSGIVVS